MGLEASMTKLGGGVNELEVDLLWSIPGSVDQKGLQKE